MRSLWRSSGFPLTLTLSRRRERVSLKRFAQRADSLAVRSESAAREIRQLMDASSTSTEHGTVQVAQQQQQQANALKQAISLFRLG